jgi:hypothetical protein
MYYKAIKSNLSFNEAINSLKDGNIIRHEDILFNPKDMNIKDFKFSIEQIASNSWEVVDIDYDMMKKLDEVRDMMYEINLNIDSRFYQESLMNISSYWNLFENQFILVNEDLQFEIMKYYYEKYKANKKY